MLIIRFYQIIVVNVNVNKAWIFILEYTQVYTAISLRHKSCRRLIYNMEKQTLKYVVPFLANITESIIVSRFQKILYKKNSKKDSKIHKKLLFFWRPKADLHRMSLNTHSKFNFSSFDPSNVPINLSSISTIYMFLMYKGVRLAFPEWISYKLYQSS